MAVRFASASSQYLRYEGGAAFDFRQPYTVLFSVCLNSDRNDYTVLMHLESTLGAGNVDFIQTDFTGTRLEFGTESAGSTTASDLVVGEWAHLALVRSSSTDLRLYRDGAQIGDAVTTDVSGRETTRYIYVGCWFTAALFLDGRVANMKCYSRALSGDEQRREHRMLRPGSMDSLWGWFPMLHGDLASAVKDYSGSGRNFTAYNTPTIEDGPPTTWGASIFVPQRGIVGPTLSLPGVQDITSTTARPKVTLTYA